MKKITLILLLLVTIHSTRSQEENNYKIKNLEVNTKYSDFGVTYLGDSSAVFASSRKNKGIAYKIWNGNRQPYLELFKGKVSAEGEIEDISLFSKKINTKYHESNVTFTKDKKTVYFSRNNYFKHRVKKDSTGMVLIQMYKATVGEHNEWTDVEPMPFNSDNYQTGHPVLNASEDKLYFTSDMPGTFGMTDIFVVEINADGTYGTPKNLGPKVNTPKREMFPYIGKKNVLYYSSDGHTETKGNLDVYAIAISENNTAITKAQNLGSPINSSADDFGLTFKPGKNWGHFSSNRSEGKGDDDIYYFEEHKTIPAKCRQFAKGVVREEYSGALLPGALVVLYGKDGEKIESSITDSYATFGFKVDCERSYKVIGTKENYSEDQETFATTQETGLELDLGLTLSPKEFAKVRGILMIDLDPIYFDLDKSFIRPDAAIELEKVVRIMNKYPELIIKLGSHTDSRATDKYNWSLSDRRAKSTIEWIINRGIDALRISGKGYGETQLVNKCSDGVECSEAAHQLNRRSEFVIVNPEAIK